MNTNNAAGTVNSDVRKRQVMVVGALVALLAAVGVIAYVAIQATTDEKEAATKKNMSRVSITTPGQVKDSEAWRTEAENALKKSGEEAATAKRKAEATEKMAQEDRANLGKVQSELQEYKKKSETLSDTIRKFTEQGTTPNTALGQGTQARTALNQPLPTASNRVLPPPGGIQLNQFAAPPSNAGNNLSPKGSAIQTSGGTDRDIEVFDFRNDREDDGDGAPSNRRASTKPVSLTTNEGATERSSPANGASRRMNAGAGTFIPAGTFTPASQLNGVLAPATGQAQGSSGNPHPMFFEATDFSNMPNLRKLNAKGCRVLGAATGDLSSERTYVRLETMTCVFPNGEAVEMPVKGHVIGEDGIIGIPGKVVSKSGRIIGAQLVAEFAKGVGNGFRAYATTQTNTVGGVVQNIDPGRYGQAALGTGLAGGADALANYYIKLSNQLFPVIETHGGRIVELAFTQGVDFPRNLSGLDPEAFKPIKNNVAIGASQ
jgi:conjugal transfer pilus assembly protein TraB